MNSEKKLTDSLLIMSNADYHASPGMSSSGLKHLARSPAHYKAYKENGIAQTANMRLGSAIHAMALESGSGVLQAPGSTRNTNLYKEFEKAHPGQILLLEDEMEAARRSADAVLKHPTARRLLTSGLPELSGFWNDPNTGVKCRFRPDYLREDGVIVDLKSTSDASAQAFQSAMSSFKYHWQTAWYLRGLSAISGRKELEFVHIVVETSAPFGVNVFAIDAPSLYKANEDIEKLLSIYAEAEHTGQWDSYPIGIQSLSIRPWEFQS